MMIPFLIGVVVGAMLGFFVTVIVMINRED